jgi:hypothetical protein
LVWIIIHPDRDARITTLRDLILRTIVPSPRAPLSVQAGQALQGACRP